MNNREKEKSKESKWAIISLVTGLLGLLSFFLMFNWTQGEYLVVPTSLLGFTCLITGIISGRQMLFSGERRSVNANTFMPGFGIVIGVFILLWFCIAIFSHY